MAKKKWTLDYPTVRVLKSKVPAVHNLFAEVMIAGGAVGYQMEKHQLGFIYYHLTITGSESLLDKFEQRIKSILTAV